MTRQNFVACHSAETEASFGGKNHKVEISELSLQHQTAIILSSIF
jgi:hypothetical protein